MNRITRWIDHDTFVPIALALRAEARAASWIWRMGLIFVLPFNAAWLLLGGSVWVFMFALVCFHAMFMVWTFPYWGREY